MPPNFKTANQPGHANNKNNNNSNNHTKTAPTSTLHTEEDTASKRASYVENLFPDKFGKQPQQQQQQQQQSRPNSPSDPFSRQSKERNGNNQQSSQPQQQQQQQQQQKSWCFMPGTTDANGVPRVIPRLGVPVPMPKITGPTRRQRSTSAGNSNNNNKSGSQNNNTKTQQAQQPKEVRHISWEREMIKKIHPIKMIGSKDKPHYWFQEALEESNEAEFVTLNIGSCSIIEPAGPTTLRLVGWEKEETGSVTGRVTLYMNQLPSPPQRPDPSKMVAICTLNPFANAIPVKIVMPPGPYIIEARYCNKKLASPAQKKDQDEPKLLLLLETQGQTFGLR